MAIRLNFIIFIGLSIICFGNGDGDNRENVTDLHLIGLFPFSGLWDGGHAMLAAVQMALDDINDRSDILPGYRLNMSSRNTSCDRGLGAKVFFEEIHEPKTKIMIIGAGCSHVSQIVARSAGFWNLIQISYISLSAALSGESKYPNFFRILTSERVLNEARMQLFKRLNWTRVAVVYENHHLFHEIVENLETRANRNNIELINKGAFSEDPMRILQRIQKEDARVIIGGFYTGKAKAVLCAAYKTGFYGNKVWIMSSFIPHNSDWLYEYDPQINCTGDEMTEVLKGSLTVSNIYTNDNDTDEGFSGRSLQSFRENFRERTSNLAKPVTGAEQAPIAYDTMWAAAIALNKTMNNLTESGDGQTLADFTYTSKKMANLLKTSMHEVKFTSVSGPVGFNRGGDGIRLIEICVFEESSFRRVGTYDRTKRLEDRLDVEIDDIWKDGIPKDTIETKEVFDLVPVSTYAVMTSLASLGIILAVLFLGFNVFYRDVKIIRMSSPHINNIILAGCVMAYLSVYIEDINDTKHSVFCTAKFSLLLLAFSLSFGALFAKTWRIHRIFTASRQLKTKVIKDITLCLMVLGLVGVNTIVLLAWFIFDPQTVLSQSNSQEAVSADLMIQYKYTYCSSDKEKYFLITILTIQGLLLFLGVFLAWETRKVPFSVMNESRYIGMCIYNVVTLGVAGAFASLYIGSNINMAYIIVSCATILCTTVTQCLLFVPKILAYRDYVTGKLTDASFTTNPALAESLQSHQRGINEAIQTDVPDDSECGGHVEAVGEKSLKCEADVE